MAAQLEDRVLDFGLNVLDTESTAIYIVSSATEPTTYALATSGAGSLGYKSFGAGSVFGSPAADGGGNGRKVSSVAVTDGTIVTSGTAAASRLNRTPRTASSSRSASRSRHWDASC